MRQAEHLHLLLRLLFVVDVLLEYVVVFGLGLNQLKKPDFLAGVDFAGAGFGACQLEPVFFDDVGDFEPPPKSFLIPPKKRNRSSFLLAERSLLRFLVTLPLGQLILYSVSKFGIASMHLHNKIFFCMGSGTTFSFSK